MGRESSDDGSVPIGSEPDVASEGVLSPFGSGAQPAVRSPRSLIVQPVQFDILAGPVDQGDLRFFSGIAGPFWDALGRSGVQRGLRLWIRFERQFWNLSFPPLPALFETQHPMLAFQFYCQGFEVQGFWAHRVA